MRPWALIAASLAAGCMTVASATAAKLGDSALKTAVSGKTVKIDTPIGLPLTVNYGANGLMTGSVGTALAAYLGSARDRGRWKVHNGRLCQKWFKWLASEETCMTIHQEGMKIFWKTDTGRTGTAMIEPGPPVLAGASASGLGLPMPAAAPPAPSALAPETGEYQPPVVREAATPAPTPIERPAMPEATAEAPRLAVRHEPELVEQPRQVVLASAAPLDRASMAIFAVARPAPPAEPPSHNADGPSGSKPQETGLAAMRVAADTAAAAAIEHRWCLANALGTVPVHDSIKFALDPYLPIEPNLMLVAIETLAPDELAMHEPSCMTGEPALQELSRFVLR
jgi:hypothetical protein